METKIGDDGYAIKERHHTVHNPNHLHSNPHDHTISWSFPRSGMPNFGPAENYWDDNIPEFKNYLKGSLHMSAIIYDDRTPEDMRFKTISDFKECIIRGGEPTFMWNGIRYGVCFYENGYCIAHASGEYEKLCDNPDDVLEYMVGSDRLRDVITQVTVLDRTI